MTFDLTFLSVTCALVFVVKKLLELIACIFPHVIFLSLTALLLLEFFFFQATFSRSSNNLLSHFLFLFSVFLFQLIGYL
jgi:hypothetical protein